MTQQREASTLQKSEKEAFQEQADTLQSTVVSSAGFLCMSLILLAAGISFGIVDTLNGGSYRLVTAIIAVAGVLASGFMTEKLSSQFVAYQRLLAQGAQNRWL